MLRYRINWIVSAVAGLVGIDITYCPYFDIVPVYNRVYPYKRGPSRVRGVKMLQVLAMWVCPACADQYGLD